MNNSSSRFYDLVIIGTGVAASTVAYECNAYGWKIAIIDSIPFSGTCASRGCDPKKDYMCVDNFCDIISFIIFKNSVIKNLSKINIFFGYIFKKIS